MFNSRKRLKTDQPELNQDEPSSVDDSKSSQAPARGDQPMFELLEPRLLYSADILGVVAAHLPDDSYQIENDYVGSQPETNDNEESEIIADTAEPVLTHPVEIVFIDERVEDANIFVNTWAAPGVQFVVISEKRRCAYGDHEHASIARRCRRKHRYDPDRIARC